MSNLPEGDILTLDGRRCTRVPRNASNADSDGATFSNPNPDPPLPTSQSAVDLANPSAGLVLKDEDNTNSAIPTTSSAPPPPQPPQPPAATNPEPVPPLASPTDDVSSQSVISGANPGEVLVVSTLDDDSVVTITSTSGESQAAEPTAAPEDNLAPPDNAGDDTNEEDDAGSSGVFNAQESQQVGVSDVETEEEEDGSQSTVAPAPTSEGDSDEVDETNGQEGQENEEGDNEIETEEQEEDDAGGAGAGASPATSSPGGSPEATGEPVTTTLPNGVVATTFPTGNNFSGDRSDIDAEDDDSEGNSGGNSNDDEEEDDGEGGNGEDDEDDTNISPNEETDDSSDDNSEPERENQGSPSQGAGEGITGSEQSNDNGSSIDGRQAGMIAGGVVGGVAAIALMVFLIWFCKKRQRDRKHQYVIHTPVMAGPRSGGDGSSWEYDNSSVGPTSRKNKFAEAFGSKVDALGRRMRAASMYGGDPAADANRRNTAFFNSPSRRERDSRISPEAGDLSTKDRIGDWWSRMREDANFNWRLRNGDVTEIVDYNAYSRRPNDVEVPRRSLSDVRDVRQSGQRFSRALDGQRFSGALGVMLNDARARGNDPFSDNNETPWNTGQADPFDDSNQVAPPSAAAGATVYNPTQPLPHRGPTTGSVRRPRGSTRPDRTNAKSDQFDLEIDSITKPASTHRRHDSYTSDVSSLSDDDLGGPGPDVGRAALNWADGKRASPPVEKSPSIGQGTWPLRG